mmetsp:Transcript_54002/g.151803  ORF Transcript_54002/g.151803 Transcript_54002/m.151803 type:complete len:218 (+) Transcript_54002:9-662(+)
MGRDMRGKLTPFLTLLALHPFNIIRSSFLFLRSLVSSRSPSLPARFLGCLSFGYRCRFRSWRLNDFQWWLLLLLDLLALFLWLRDTWLGKHSLCFFHADRRGSLGFRLLLLHHLSWFGTARSEQFFLVFRHSFFGRYHSFGCLFLGEALLLCPLSGLSPFLGCLLCGLLRSIAIVALWIVRVQMTVPMLRQRRYFDVAGQNTPFGAAVTLNPLSVID